jgi:hypothetical protein
MGFRRQNLRWRLDFFSDVDGIFVHATLALKFVEETIGSKIRTREIVVENEG